MVVLCALFFACGYKVGDSSGYKDGYEVGYRYDCKEEIGTIYNQVQSQSRALSYTDSVIKKVMRENDSLKRKEYYQKRLEDSLAVVNTFTLDSVKYSKVAKKLSDSLSKAVGLYSVNVIQSNGQRNELICAFHPAFKNLKECRGEFNVREKLDKMMKKSKGKKVKK